MSARFTVVKLFFSKNEYHYIIQNQIDFLKMRIHYNHRYKRSNTSLDKKPVIYKTHFVMKNIYDIQIKSINFL